MLDRLKIKTGYFQPNLNSLKPISDVILNILECSWQSAYICLYEFKQKEISIISGANHLEVFECIFPQVLNIVCGAVPIAWHHNHLYENDKMQISKSINRYCFIHHKNTRRKMLQLYYAYRLYLPDNKAFFVGI